jgi:hypothetical protein
MQARRSVISLAALARGVRQSNAKNKLRAQLVGGGLLQRDEIAAARGALAVKPTLPSGIVALIASKAVAVMLTWDARGGARAARLQRSD